MTESCLQFYNCCFSWTVTHCIERTALSFSLSNSPHTLQAETAEAGEDQRLLADGGGVYQEPGTDETPGGETGGTHHVTENKINSNA